MDIFKEWVEKTHRHLVENRKRYTVMISPKNPRITFCFDSRTGKVGVARCHPSDTPYAKVGAAIAYARCKGYEIPKQKTYKKLSEMKNGEEFYNPFMTFGSKVFRFIGECMDSQNNKAYVIQHVVTGRLGKTRNRDNNFEMVD